MKIPSAGNRKGPDGRHTFQAKIIKGYPGWECVHCKLWHDYPRGAALPPEVDQCPPQRIAHVNWK